MPSSRVRNGKKNVGRGTPAGRATDTEREIETATQRVSPYSGPDLDKARPWHSVPPDAPKQAAIDFGLLELLLPGYLAENAKEFRQPVEAPVYEPLPGPDWIRLLVIEPWSADENLLRCHLKAVRLDDAAGKYYALSYCWGQAVRGEVQSLLCNGRGVDAADNLRLALENIRYSTLPRIV